MHFGKLETKPVSEAMGLLAKPVAEAVALMDVSEIEVVEIDPSLADTAEFCKHYDISLKNSANCVIVEATRGDKKWLAACIVLATAKADVNGLVRRHLGARRVSFASMETALAQTGMEYGGISPIGLPEDWPILIDSAVVSTDWVVIGSGIRGSKLIIPGKLLTGLKNAVVLENLAK